ncbi:MAG: long-chain-acyl-CoA synthetase [Pseudomonadota bacterium]
MPVLTKAREVARVLREMGRVLPALSYKLPELDEQASLGALFEDTVARCPGNTMLLFEGREWTYEQFNREANQLAHLLSGCGIDRGDTVALLMENRAEYLLSLLALAKLGAAASLINNSLTGPALVHCVQATGARACIFGEERLEPLNVVRQELGFSGPKACLYMADSGAVPSPDWAMDLREAMPSMPTHNLPVTREIAAGETAMYIFTSGTTGLPKAAVVMHRRILGAGNGLGRLGFQVQPQDRLYLCLPVYHITGLGPGFCGFISEGASIVLRPGFSASRFWSEVQHYRANCFIYVGELCRYLTMQPPSPEEKNNPLRKMLGNGLRPDVWDEFKQRFDVERICEIYGSSEGNVTFLNLLNKDRTIGAAISKVALVRYDADNDEVIRDAEGRCIEVPLGEPGLLLGKITPKASFEGYTNPEATAGKILRDVLEAGDRWFNTGDLVRQIDVGFAMGLKHYQFVDRTGDTFRWRAENVSTNEVGEVLNAHPQIQMANVYGVEVPEAEGRAGMVAFALEEDEDFDMEAFQRLVEEQLPAYAQPVFVRVQRDIATTGTFKLLKGELREQSYHLDKVGDDTIYVRKPRSEGYELLDEDFYRRLLAKSAGY